MNKEELTITNEDIELLKEMKNNCLKADVYNDEKRLLKANAITKFLMLQQENNQLKEQYCERTDCVGRLGNSRKVEKLIKENKELHNKIDKAIDFIDIYTNGINLEAFDCLKLMYKIKDLLKDSNVDE